MGKENYYFFLTFILVGSITARSTNILFPDRLFSINSTDLPSVEAILPSPSTCGKIEYFVGERILKGNPSLLGKWPWIVAIGYKNGDDSPLIWSCAGTLITNKHVLTTAHCTNYKIPIMARLGDLNLDPNVDDGATPLDIPIERAISHERFNRKNGRNNNIAILKLKKPVTFTEFIQPICLPVSSNVRDTDLENTMVSVAGWGPADDNSNTGLFQKDILVTNHAECKETYESPTVQIDDKVICVRNLEEEESSCQGASGGPLIYSKDNQFYLMGVVTYGSTLCATGNQPGVHTKVSYFIDWILGKINRDYV